MRVGLKREEKFKKTLYKTLKITSFAFQVFNKPICHFNVLVMYNRLSITGTLAGEVEESSSYREFELSGARRIAGGTAQ